MTDASSGGRCTVHRYVLGLSHVDLIHAVYMLLFVIMFTSPPIRRKYVAGSLRAPHANLPCCH